MLVWLAEYFEAYFRPLGVFQYLTLRGILGVMTALFVSLLLGPWFIRTMVQKQIGQTVRNDGPKSHLSKSGTPTMGGTLLLFAIVSSVLLWSDLSNRFVWVVLAVTVGFGAIGWVDDYRKVVHRNPKGLSARVKFFWQSVIGLAAADTVWGDVGDDRVNARSDV
ncbi:MAG: hypothetical protein ACTS5I_18330, partial [Rhodanobacter sp.]